MAGMDLFAGLSQIADRVVLSNLQLAKSIGDILGLQRGRSVRQMLTCIV
jgi:hypothetical protein